MKRSVSVIAALAFELPLEISANGDFGVAADRPQSVGVVGQSYSATHYSSLDQITAETLRTHPGLVVSTRALCGHEG
jgi:hypothetical protein